MGSGTNIPAARSRSGLWSGFHRGIRATGIRDQPTLPQSPRQKADTERLIGSIRRECVDHILVFGERHLRHALLSYMNHYNEVRTHLSLGKDAPVSRVVHAVGQILPRPILGGLHHEYVRSDLRQGEANDAVFCLSGAAPHFELSRTYTCKPRSDDCRGPPQRSRHRSSAARAASALSLSTTVAAELRNEITDRC